MNYVTAEELRAFEKKTAELWEAGELPYLLHLSGGNENFLVEMFQNVNDGDWIFSTHRNHHHALCSGIRASRLREMINRGDSMFVFDRERKFFSSAILAGTCCIATGVAHALKAQRSNNHVWVFIGDGATENGHFAEAVHMVQWHELPCTFIVEDNNRAVEATKFDRRGHRDALPVMNFIGCVRTNFFRATYPHAGNGTTRKIVFRKR